MRVKEGYLYLRIFAGVPSYFNLCCNLSSFSISLSASASVGFSCSEVGCLSYCLITVVYNSHSQNFQLICCSLFNMWLRRWCTPCSSSFMCCLMSVQNTKTHIKSWSWSRGEGFTVILRNHSVCDFQLGQWTSW